MDKTNLALRAERQEALEREWVDGATAARLLGISRTHLYKLISRGTVYPYKLGALTVYSRPEILRARRARIDWEGADAVR